MECVSFKFKTRFTYQKIVEWIWLHLPQCDFISIDILRLLCYTNKKKMKTKAPSFISVYK